MAQLINEAKRLQKLAGIITESESTGNPQDVAKAEKKAFDIAKSEEFNKHMESVWQKLSDEDKQKLTQSLSSLQEAIGGDFSSFQHIVDKAEDVAGVNEDASDSDVKAKVGNILGTIGKVNSLTFGVPGAVTIAKAAGLGAFLGFAPAMLASLVAGGMLWWLGKKIAGEKSSPHLDENF